MPLERQVEALLGNASVAPFAQLRSLLGLAEAEEARLLAVLARKAVLVRGVWVIASDQLYQDLEDLVEAIGQDLLLVE